VSGSRYWLVSLSSSSPFASNRHLKLTLLPQTSNRHYYASN
jgi:hypothetical protein